MKATLKKYFITGLLIIVPILVSWLVLLRLIRWLYGTLNFNILPDSLSARKLTFLPDVAAWALDRLLSVADFGLALLTVVLVILFTGMIARAWIMRKMLHIGESIINSPAVGGHCLSRQQTVDGNHFSGRIVEFSACGDGGISQGRRLDACLCDRSNRTCIRNRWWGGKWSMCLCPQRRIPPRAF